MVTQVTLPDYEQFVAKMINPNLSDREKMSSYGMGIVGEAIEAWQTLGTSLVLSASDDRNDALDEVGDYAHYLTGLYLMSDNSIVESSKDTNHQWLSTFKTTPARDGLLYHGKAISEYIKKSQYHVGKPPVSSFAMRARLDDALGHLLWMLPYYNMNLIEVISLNVDKLNKRYAKLITEK